MMMVAGVWMVWRVIKIIPAERAQMNVMLNLCKLLMAQTVSFTLLGMNEWG